MSEIQANWMMEQSDIPAEEIPWYRMRWIFILTFLLFYPAMLILGLTGNIYGKQKGEVFKFTNKGKYFFLTIGFLLMVGSILRQL